MKKKLPNPDKPLSKKEWQSLGPLMRGVEALPKKAQKAIRRAGRPPVAEPKQAVSIRLDPEILEILRANGKGWQTQLNAFLHRAIKDGQL